MPEEIRKLARQASLFIPVHHHIGCDFVNCKAKPVNSGIRQTRVLPRFGGVIANGTQGVKISR